MALKPHRHRHLHTRMGQRCLEIAGKLRVEILLEISDFNRIYLFTDEFQSFYAGGGLAWGGVVSYDQVFYGIVPSATLGFEMFRKSNTLAFSELCINQPALAVAHEGKFPGPIIELTLGMGF